MRAMTNIVEPMLLWSGPRGSSVPVANNIVDQYIFDRMSADGVPPASGATDTELIRRFSLDLTGRIPSIERVQSFIASRDPTKRSCSMN